MAERRIGAQGSEEGLLECVLGTLPPEPADEQPEHLVPMLGVEALERRHHGGSHHPWKRSGAPLCEMPLPAGEPGVGDCRDVALVGAAAPADDVHAGKA